MAGTKRWIALVVTVLLVCATGIVSAQDGAALCVQPTMVWDEATGECHLINSGTNPSGVTWRYDVLYPVEVLDEPFIQASIDGLLQTQIDAFREAVEATPSSPGELFLEMDYDVYTFDDNVFSVVFAENTYTGGAHPNLYYYTLTFDRENDEVLALQDLFLSGSTPLDLIVPTVREQLYATLGDDEASRSFIDPGTDYDYANYAAFAISEDDLIFLFPPYQVAPYAAGPQLAAVPLDTLTAIWIIGDDADPVRKG